MSCCAGTPRTPHAWESLSGLWLLHHPAICRFHDAMSNYRQAPAPQMKRPPAGSQPRTALWHLATASPNNMHVDQAAPPGGDGRSANSLPRPRATRGYSPCGGSPGLCWALLHSPGRTLVRESDAHAAKEPLHSGPLPRSTNAPPKPPRLKHGLNTMSFAQTLVVIAHPSHDLSLSHETEHIMRRLSGNILRHQARGGSCSRRTPNAQPFSSRYHDVLPNPGIRG